MSNAADTNVNSNTLSGVDRVEIRFCRASSTEYAGELQVPRYETIGASGVDLHAALNNPITIAPSERSLIPTGLSIAIPDGYEGQVRPRSGLALRYGVTVLNSPGTIDSDYRGEVQVLLINLGNKPFIVSKGDRIAQLVIVSVAHAAFVLVSALDDTLRGRGGYGSTGV